jgi:hypothetical protein
MSISAEPGPVCSAQSGPIPVVDPCAMERSSRESMGGARAGSERASGTLASGRRGVDRVAIDPVDPRGEPRGAARGTAQARFLKRQLSLPVSRMSQ